MFSTQLYMQISTNLRCFRKFLKLEARARNLQVANEQWTPPPPPVFKMDVDAALFRDEQAYGVGVVIN